MSREWFLSVTCDSHIHIRLDYTVPRLNGQASKAAVVIYPIVFNTVEHLVGEMLQ